MFHLNIDPKNNPNDCKWFDENVDLSEYGGQKANINYETLPGSAGNANFDCGGWSSPVFVVAHP
jgi:hypothetical protein